MSEMAGSKPEWISSNVPTTAAVRRPWSPRKPMSAGRERDYGGSDWLKAKDLIDEKPDDVETISEGLESASLATTGVYGMVFGDSLDEKVKQRREYESDYANLALKGGHKDLLAHKENAFQSEECTLPRRQKSCSSESEYVKIARQGGLKDLLVIEENKPSSQAAGITKRDDDNAQHSKLTAAHDKDARGQGREEVACPKSAPAPAQPSPAKNHRNFSSISTILPAGPEQQPRFGKKRFEQTGQRRDAPFATNL